MKPSSLIAIWHRPKAVMYYFHTAAWSHYRLMLVLALGYFILFGTFILSLEKITLAPLLSLDGLKLILWFFLLVGIRSFVIIYVAAFALWTTARFFKGQGTLPQTRGAVIWTLISSLPIGFFLLLINFAFRHPDMGLLSILIRIVSYAGILGTLIYGTIILLKTIAETHQLTAWRTFFATSLGLILLSMILFAGSAYFF